MEKSLALVVGVGIGFFVTFVSRTPREFLVRTFTKTVVIFDLPRHADRAVAIELLLCRSSSKLIASKIRNDQTVLFYYVRATAQPKMSNCTDSSASPQVGFSQTPDDWSFDTLYDLGISDDSALNDFLGVLSRNTHGLAFQGAPQGDVFENAPGLKMSQDRVIYGIVHPKGAYRSLAHQDYHALCNVRNFAKDGDSRYFTTTGLSMRRRDYGFYASVSDRNVYSSCCEGHELRFGSVVCSRKSGVQKKRCVSFATPMLICLRSEWRENGRLVQFCTTYLLFPEGVHYRGTHDLYVPSLSTGYMCPELAVRVENETTNISSTEALTMLNSICEKELDNSLCKRELKDLITRLNLDDSCKSQSLNYRIYTSSPKMIMCGHSVDTNGELVDLTSVSSERVQTHCFSEIPIAVAGSLVRRPYFENQMSSRPVPSSTCLKSEICDPCYVEVTSKQDVLDRLGELTMNSPSESSSPESSLSSRLQKELAPGLLRASIYTSRLASLVNLVSLRSMSSHLQGFLPRSLCDSTCDSPSMVLCICVRLACFPQRFGLSDARSHTCTVACHLLGSSLNMVFGDKEMFVLDEMILKASCDAIFLAEDATGSYSVGTKIGMRSEKLGVRVPYTCPSEWSKKGVQVTRLAVINKNTMVRLRNMMIAGLELVVSLYGPRSQCREMGCSSRGNATNHHYQGSSAHAEFAASQSPDFLARMTSQELDSLLTMHGPCHEHSTCVGLEDMWPARGCSTASLRSTLVETVVRVEAALQRCDCTVEEASTKPNLIRSHMENLLNSLEPIKPCEECNVVHMAYSCVQCILSDDMTCSCSLPTTLQSTLIGSEVSVSCVDCGKSVSCLEATLCVPYRRCDKCKGCRCTACSRSREDDASTFDPIKDVCNTCSTAFESLFTTSAGCR